MRCRNCGIEIADKALICYKCGAATTEAAFKAPPRRGRSSLWATLLGSVVALGIVVLLAVAMGRGQMTGGPASVVAVAVAVAVVIVRAIVRRSGRAGR